MRCPSCHAPFAAPLPQCPECRLTLRRLDTRFGAVPRHSLFVTDRSDTLPLRAINSLRALLNLFQQRFPQSLFSVFVLSHVENGSIAEYTFWLANRARFSSEESVEGENFDLLLGIDLQARTAALQIGYGLENYLGAQDLRRALAHASSAFQAGDIPGGVRLCVEFMTERMRELAKEIEAQRLAESSAAVTEAEQL